MSIDYFIQYPCKVRDSVSEHDLLRMQKAQRRVNLTIALMRGSPGLDPDKVEQFIVMEVLGASEPVEQKINMEDLLIEAAPLGALSRHCKGCPANLRETAFGCGGAIHYPILEETEQWLVSRLPDDLSDLVGQLLVLVISDRQFDGALVDADRWRRVIYAAEQPAMRQWNGFSSKTTWLSSSQILHMLIGSGRLSPLHAGMASWFLGFLDADMQPEHRVDNTVTESDPPGIAEFKVFLLAAAFAGSNNYHLFVDA